MKVTTQHFIKDIIAIAVIGLMSLKAPAASSELAFAIAALCGATGVSRYFARRGVKPKKVKKEKANGG